MRSMVLRAKGNYLSTQVVYGIVRCNLTGSHKCTSFAINIVIVMLTEGMELKKINSNRPMK